MALGFTPPWNIAHWLLKELIRPLAFGVLVCGKCMDGAACCIQFYSAVHTDIFLYFLFRFEIFLSWFLTPNCWSSFWVPITNCATATPLSTYLPDDSSQCDKHRQFEVFTMRKNLPKLLDLLIFCIYSLNFSLAFFIMIFFVTIPLNISKFLPPHYIKH